MGFRRIQFLSRGFKEILTSPGVEARVAAEARKQARAKEAESGSPYQVERMPGARSRVVYIAKPEDEEGRVPNLDHETWMREVWPRVGGPSWRPHR